MTEVFGEFSKISLVAPTYRVARRARSREIETVIELFGVKRETVARRGVRSWVVVTTGLVICLLGALAPGVVATCGGESGDAECPVEEAISVVQKAVCRHQRPKPDIGRVAARLPVASIVDRHLPAPRSGFLAGHSFPGDVSTPLLC